MKKIIFLSFFIVKSFCYSLILVNDSPFELTAIIQSATGVVLGQESLQPNEQRQWSTEMISTDVEEIYDAKFSLTPFTVIWKCSKEGYYSICTDVSPGSTVKAHTCDGSKECSFPEKKDK